MDTEPKLTTLIDMGDGLAETLSPAAIAAAHEQSRRDDEAFDRAEQARTKYTLSRMKEIAVGATTDREW